MNETETLTDQILHALKRWGIDHKGIHLSWRCEHPDRFGECDCHNQFRKYLTETLNQNKNTTGDPS